MSDCEKCWATPCECGFGYIGRDKKYLIEMRDMFQSLINGNNKYSPKPLELKHKEPDQTPSRVIVNIPPYCGDVTLLSYKDNVTGTSYIGSPCRNCKNLKNPKKFCGIEKDCYYTDPTNKNIIHYQKWEPEDEDHDKLDN